MCCTSTLFVSVTGSFVIVASLADAVFDTPNLSSVSGTVVAAAPCLSSS
jgi:hypothetical protein